MHALSTTVSKVPQTPKKVHCSRCITPAAAYRTAVTIRYATPTPVQRSVNWMRNLCGKHAPVMCSHWVPRTGRFGRLPTTMCLSHRPVTGWHHPSGAQNVTTAAHTMLHGSASSCNTPNCIWKPARLKPCAIICNANYASMNWRPTSLPSTCTIKELKVAWLCRIVIMYCWN